VPPVAENEASDGESDQGSSHVDANKRPWICFERGEDRNSCVFHEDESEPANEGDFQTTQTGSHIVACDQHRQGVVHDDRRDEREDVGADIVGPLDIGRGLGMKIEPGFTEDGVPTPADKEINYDENPDDAMIDSSVHEANWIIRAPRFAMQADLDRRDFGLRGRFRMRCFIDWRRFD